MSALAQVSHRRGAVVSGSDRSHDRGIDAEFFAQLASQGISLYPQDGSGITSALDEVIISAAVEDDNPDLQKARALRLPITLRSHFLARLFNSCRGIAVAGSSGKSTITAMAAQIMEAGHLDPTVINGAVIRGYERFGGPGNVRVGSSEYVLVETDESDSSLVHFHPEVGILANISKDHKPLPELSEIFYCFLKNVKGQAIVNIDCPHVQELYSRFPSDNVVSFGIKHPGHLHPADIVMGEHGSTFTVHGTIFRLPVPGVHNISNALAAIALGTTLGLSLKIMSAALQQFRGVARRLELIGTERGIKVFDDYAHNPAKIAAALETLKAIGKRVILIYQPHGYGPTRFLKDELTETFNRSLTSDDVLILLDIYYAGGTVDPSITSAELLEGVHIPQAEGGSDRERIVKRVRKIATTGDVIVVMGARDSTLSDLARSLVESLGKEP